MMPPTASPQALINGGQPALFRLPRPVPELLPWREDDGRPRPPAPDPARAGPPVPLRPAPAPPPRPPAGPDPVLAPGVELERAPCDVGRRAAGPGPLPRGVGASVALRLRGTGSIRLSAEGCTKSSDRTRSIGRRNSRSISASNLSSSRSTSDTAAPGLPARPVRPMRWT